MSAVETGQMSAAETGQMSSAETRQMSTGKTGRCPVPPFYICLVSAEHICPVSAADICPISTQQQTSVLSQQKTSILTHLWQCHNVQVADRWSGPKSTKMVRHGSRMVAKPRESAHKHRTTVPKPLGQAPQPKIGPEPKKFMVPRQYTSAN